MPDRADVTYLYDGSFEGLLCCVFESFDKKEQPIDIQREEAMQGNLFEKRIIPTDMEKAGRVKGGIIKKASVDSFELIEYAFLTCHPQKEKLILRFVQAAMQFGRKASSMLTNQAVGELNLVVRTLLREVEKLKGFVRFSVYDNVMVSIIEPNNYVLPLLAPHFCDRYPNEAFLIFDKTHGEALLYRSGQSVIAPIQELDLPKADETEQLFTGFWKLFYDTIAIDERYNPKCRMSFMPKRYWKHLPEMADADRRSNKGIDAGKALIGPAGIGGPR